MNSQTVIPFSFLFCYLHSSVIYAQEATPIPEPTVRILANTDLDTEGSFQISRIAGCYGDIEKARQNIISSDGVLKEPYFSESDYHPSIFALQQENPVCVLGNEPSPSQRYEGHILSLSDYAYEQLHCECGDCYDENGHSLSTADINSNITAEMEKNYALYRTKRETEVKQGKINHQRYMDDYKAWYHKRTTSLSSIAIHMRVTPQTDIPAGVLTVYNFVWKEFWGCNGLYSADRTNFHTRLIQHPAIKAGERLDIWLDDVDVNLSWGIVMHASPNAAASEIQRIQEQANVIQLYNQAQDKKYSIPLRTLPKTLAGRIYETPEARSTTIASDCGCSC